MSLFWRVVLMCTLPSSLVACAEEAGTLDSAQGAGGSAVDAAGGMHQPWVGGGAGKPSVGGSGAGGAQGSASGAVAGAVERSLTESPQVEIAADCEPILQPAVAPQFVASVASNPPGGVEKALALEGQLLFSRRTSPRGDWGDLSRFDTLTQDTLKIEDIARVRRWTAWGLKVWLPGNPTRYADLAQPTVLVDAPFSSADVAAGEMGLVFTDYDTQSIYLWPDYSGEPRRLVEVPEDVVLHVSLSARSPLGLWFAHIEDWTSCKTFLQRASYDGTGSGVVTTLDECTAFGTPLAIPNPDWNAAYVVTSSPLAGATIFDYVLHRVRADGFSEVWARGELVDIAVDDHFVYWIDKFTVWKRRHCGGEAAVVAYLTPEPAHLAIHGNALWVLVGQYSATAYRIDLPEVAP